MKLANKNLLYSIILAGVVGIFIIGYLLLMLPSLYTAYRKEVNYDDFKTSFTSFIENEGNSAEAIPTKSFGIKIPLDGYKIEISNNSMKGNIEIKDKDLRDILDKLREAFKNSKNLEKNKGELKDSGKEFEKIFEKLKEKFRDNNVADTNMISVDIKLNDNATGFSEENTKFYSLGERSFIIEMSVKDIISNIDYTTFFGVNRGENAYLIEVAGVVDPSVTDIIPVILSVLPVIIPVIILLIFITSGLYSKNIVKPITLLLQDADNRRGGTGYIEPIVVKGNDEIAGLAQSLNLLYKAQEEAYDKLNKESERKEIFMRSFSHQLKTPVAAAALLTDGMIANIGKFSDRDKYLPEVKKQLMNVKQMTDEILRINHIADNISSVNTEVKELVEYALNSSKVAAEVKNLTIICNGNGIWYIDPNVFEQIILNLVSNAVKYTAEGGEIRAEISNETIKIINYPAHIDDSIKDSLFEAFVTGGDCKEGHGLGLYVAKYFAELLGLYLKCESLEEKVTFILQRKEAEIC